MTKGSEYERSLQWSKNCQEQGQLSGASHPFGVENEQDDSRSWNGEGVA